MNSLSFYLSAEPAAIFESSGLQAHLSKFISKLCLCPMNIFTIRSLVTKGRMSQMRKVLSIEFDNTYDPQFESDKAVIVSLWPRISCVT